LREARNVAHAVQLFDSDDTLSVHVATFLHRGYLQGEQLRVIATSEHMAAIARHLGNLGCPVPDALASGRLRWMDAASTLQMLMPGRPPDEAHLRSLVRGMAQARDHSHAPTRFYGEMVNLLAERGDLQGAVDLEGAWNRILTRVPATLLCGYSSSHFGDPATASALHEICHLHDDVRSDETDLLGAWLVEKSRRP
jgi:hypothetical protein